MSATIFVDTNVFVYARDPAHAQKQAMAAKWIDRLWREQSGRTSVQVLSELYVTLTRKLRPGLPADDAWEDVAALMAWNPAPLDREVLGRGREIVDRYKLNWWDSLIVAAAQLQDCDTLLTEDLQDGMCFGHVTVQNPFQRRVSEPLVPYRKVEVDAPRHRRPGRPRALA
jgi:predicted nucleic acid-binding protein